MNKIACLALGVIAASLWLPGCRSTVREVHPEQIVGMRRLTEAQYRNSIADIFGPEIVVSGRFEPIIRPPHYLIAVGATEAAISPAGLEQFDAIARGIAEQVFSDKQREQFAGCAPRDAAQPDAACAGSILMPLGRYIFRRPLTEAERQRYLDIARDATTKAGSFNRGLELALAAMLVSPNFLYVIDRAYPDPERPGTLRLDSYSRAARLSYFLWNTTPNDALLRAAERGDLSNQRTLEATAQKMVASPRFKDGVRAFFSDMLVYENFDNLSKDPIIYPRFNSDIAKLLPEQMLRTIVGHLVEEQGNYKELFTTRHTYMTRSLGTIYRVPLHSVNGWEAVSFAPDNERVGLLGQAAFLALYAHSGRSSATIRGRAIREVLLCQRVPDPPGNVNFDVVQDTSNPVYRTARARLEAHRTSPACAGCHRLTDPIGLALENYDGIGSFRAQENGVDIDPTGDLSGTKFVGLSGLGQQLATNPATTRCVTNRALEYASGRRAAAPVLAAGIEKVFAAKDYRIQALFQTVATTPSLYEVAVPTGNTTLAGVN